MRVSDLWIRAYEIMAPGLLAVLTWVAAKAAQWISARVQSEYLRNALLRLDDTILAVVREIQQVTVDEIKSASADGRLPVDIKERLRRVALDAVKSHIGAKGLAELAKVLGIDAASVDSFMATRVEAAVHDLRRTPVMNGVNAGAEPVPFVH